MTTPDTAPVELPKITKAYVEGLIVGEYTRCIAETKTTICSVMLRNGQTVTHSATCGVDQCFDPVKGRSAARRKVLADIIRYEHYLLRQRIYESRNSEK